MLEMPVEITFPKLATADVAVNSRGFGSLVAAGMNEGGAKSLSRLMVQPCLQTNCYCWGSLPVSDWQ